MFSRKKLNPLFHQFHAQNAQNWENSLFGLIFRIRLITDDDDKKKSKLDKSDMITELKALEQNIMDNIIINKISLTHQGNGLHGVISIGLKV